MLPHPPSTANPQNSHIRGLRPPQAHIRPRSHQTRQRSPNHHLAHTYDFKAVIYRLANIVGPRSKHGVIYDFIEKLKANPKELEILGDGTQNKSYLHINDCIQTMLLCLEKTRNQVETYNIGSEDQTTVKTIAEIVVKKWNSKP